MKTYFSVKLTFYLKCVGCQILANEYIFSFKSEWHWFWLYSIHSLVKWTTVYTFSFLTHFVFQSKKRRYLDATKVSYNYLNFAFLHFLKSKYRQKSKMVWLPLTGYSLFLIDSRYIFLKKTFVQLLKKTAFSISFEILHGIQPGNSQ